MRSTFARTVSLAALVAAGGCFNEPVPASETVPAANRVYLSDKSLTAVPAVNPEADYLNLDRNALTDVSLVAELTKLKWLRLNDNRLSKLPDLSKLTFLRRIYLRNNLFRTVPETLKDLPSLTDIDMSGNADLAEVPAWLAEKKGLKNLSFSRTRVTKLPENLEAWRTLQSLQLGDLRIPAYEMARIRKALPKTAIVF